MRKLSKTKKLIRVLKRKWFKPALYTIALSLVIYMVIGNTVTQKRLLEKSVPQFLITRLSDKFDETEFMHLLLTVQEINTQPKASNELKIFANKPYPSPCPKLLTRQLNRMNWEPQAFQIRIKKLFAMYDVYDRITRLDETISFLKEEINQGTFSPSLLPQIDLLTQERNLIIGKDITLDEYNFIKEYAGLVQHLKNLE